MNRDEIARSRGWTGTRSTVGGAASPAPGLAGHPAARRTGDQGRPSPATDLHRENLIKMMRLCLSDGCITRQRDATAAPSPSAGGMPALEGRPSSHSRPVSSPKDVRQRLAQLGSRPAPSRTAPADHVGIGGSPTWGSLGADGLWFSVGEVGRPLLRREVATRHPTGGRGGGAEAGVPDEQPSVVRGDEHP